MEESKRNKNCDVSFGVFKKQKHYRTSGDIKQDQKEINLNYILKTITEETNEQNHSKGIDSIEKLEKRRKSSVVDVTAKPRQVRSRIAFRGLNDSNFFIPGDYI